MRSELFIYIGILALMSVGGTAAFLMLCLCQIIHIWNIKLYKFSLLSVTNEDFFSRFLLLNNFFLAFGTQIGR